MEFFKKTLGIVLAFATILTILSSCSKPVANTKPTSNSESTAESNSETSNEPTADSKPAAFELSTEDRALLGTMDKTTIEYLVTWFGMMFPQKNIELVDTGVGMLFIFLRQVNQPTLEVVIIPRLDAPDYYSAFSIQINTTNSEDGEQLYKPLCTAAALWFCDDLAEADITTLFDLKPTADGQVVYEGKKAFVTYNNPTKFIVGYSLNSGCVTLETHADTEYKSFIVTPATEMHHQINKALAQAGLSISLACARSTDLSSHDFVIYTGSGEDIYSNNISVYLTTDENGLSEFRAYIDEAGDKALDAMQKMLSAVASLCDERYTKEFMDAFFELEKEKVKNSAVPIYNQYRAYIYSEYYEILDHFELWYEEGKYTLYFSESNFFVTRNDGFKEESQAVDIVTLLNSFSQMHPGELDADLIQSFEQAIYTVIHPESEDKKFKINFNFRRQDFAITQIEINYLTNGDTEKERWFQEVTADLASLCGTGLTREDAMELYAQAVNIATSGSLLVNSYSEAGMTLNFQQLPSTIDFSIKFDLAPPPSSENIFTELNVYEGSSVTCGQFLLMNPYRYHGNDLYYVGELSETTLNKYLELYYNNVDDNIHFNYNFYDKIEDNKTTYTKLRIDLDETPCFFNDVCHFDEAHYMLTMVYDDYPHLMLNYNDNYSKLMGLEDGHYFESASTEAIRHLPIGLSLLCDSGMTAWEARELFSHSMKPDTIIDGREVTIYCPRDVAHILAYDPQTEACEYVVMTKDDLLTIDSYDDFFLTPPKNN